MEMRSIGNPLSLQEDQGLALNLGPLFFLFEFFNFFNRIT